MPAFAAGFALVHSPMVGSECWRAVASVLQQSGFVARAIDYRGVRGPDWYDGAAARISRQVGGLEQPWFLALHSAAGALAPAIVGAASTSPAAILFVDAILPHPRKSWLETAPPALAGRLRRLAVGRTLPPWNRWFTADPAAQLIRDEDLRTQFEAGLPRLPLAYLEAAAPDGHLAAGHNVAFLRLSQAYEAEATRAEEIGWSVSRASMDHLAMITQPDKVAAMIVDLTAAVLVNG